MCTNALRTTKGRTFTPEHERRMGPCRVQKNVDVKKEFLCFAFPFQPTSDFGSKVVDQPSRHKRSSAVVPIAYLRLLSTSEAKQRCCEICFVALTEATPQLWQKRAPRPGWRLIPSPSKHRLRRRRRTSQNLDSKSRSTTRSRFGPGVRSSLCDERV